MSQALFALVNPVVKAVLRSPFHGLLSRNTMILEFKGRKTGRTYSTPVSYHAVGGRIRCFTNKSSRWWRNLVDAPTVALRLRGEDRVGAPTVSADASPSVAEAFSAFLAAVPRDAPHAGVRLDAEGRPVASDVQAALDDLVLISIDV